jgi:hypothetical protein
VDSKTYLLSKLREGIVAKRQREKYTINQSFDDPQNLLNLLQQYTPSDPNSAIRLKSLLFRTIIDCFDDNWESQKVRVGIWNDPQIPLLISLGMPSNARLVLKSVPGITIKEKFSNYRVEFLGVEGKIPKELVERKRNMNLIPMKTSSYLIFNQFDTEVNCPSFQEKLFAGEYLEFPVQFEESEKKISVEVWRHRIYLRDSPIFFEEIWHPESRRWIKAICNIPDISPEDSSKFAPIISQIKEIANGLTLPLIVSGISQQGGDRSSRFSWDDDSCIKLKQTTVDLLDLWQFILNFFKRNKYARQASQWVVSTDEFNTYLKGYSKPINVLLDRVLNCRNQNGDKYQPLAFALLHAWHIIGNGEVYQYSTLKKKYDKGALLMRQNQ